MKSITPQTSSVDVVFLMNMDIYECEYIYIYIFFFLNCYSAVPQPTLGNSQGDSLSNLMLIAAF